MDKEDKDEQTSLKHGLGWYRTNRKEFQVYMADSAFYLDGDVMVGLCWNESMGAFFSVLLVLFK